MLTVRPPLTLPLTLPSMVPPSLQMLQMRSQFFFCSALPWESTTMPSSSSIFSRSTSTSSPSFNDPGSRNSYFGMTPSDLYPMSTNTSLERISIIFPFTTIPSVNSFTSEKSFSIGFAIRVILISCL